MLPFNGVAVNIEKAGASIRAKDRENRGRQSLLDEGEKGKPSEGVTAKWPALSLHNKNRALTTCGNDPRLRNSRAGLKDIRRHARGPFYNRASTLTHLFFTGMFFVFFEKVRKVRQAYVSPRRQALRKSAAASPLRPVSM